MRLSAWLLPALVVGCGPAMPQSSAPKEVAQARSEFRAWLETAPMSPFRALVRAPVATDLTLGPPGTDLPLPDLEPLAVVRRGTRLRRGGVTERIEPGQPVEIGGYRLLVSGPASGPTLTIFGHRLLDYRPPEYYPTDSAWTLRVALRATDDGESTRMLDVTGTEVEGREVGAVELDTPNLPPTRLRVFRLALRGSAARLAIYFQDPTNGQGSYPSGRFVTLEAEANGGYLLDFNRAASPYCAYNAAFACPAPWPGNTILGSVEVGERYP